MNIYDEVKWVCPECGKSNTVEILESFSDCQLCNNCGLQFDVDIEINVKSINTTKVDYYE